MSFLCSIAFIAQLAPFCVDAPPSYAGYVEGDYTQIAPLQVARIVTIHVRRGEHIDAGTMVAQLETEDAELAVREAEARAAEVRARLSDLKRGQRPEEIAAIEASLRSAEAQAREFEATLKRRERLKERGVVSAAELEQAEAQRDIAVAQVKEIEAKLAVAKLPSRSDAIVAAEEQLHQAEAALATAKWQLSERSLSVPSAGRVVDVLRRSGETAGPTAPVISFLADNAVKLRFYLPEAALIEAQPGRRVNVSCDGCMAGLEASISYIASEPEFTPPVIYSVERRQKLVYLIEAKPVSAELPIRPGQIVDVQFADSK
ncbi:MAG: HlyD family efflux transporter periplasmic adaptor subunit [Hyphomicrobiales bacterium]|nr:HlyD family efflux transporter periplasmic adaptor subunit [Hyphomicrobiales bacterium]